jgi:hypothetical protein
MLERIQALEERDVQRERQITELDARLSHVEKCFADLAGSISVTESPSGSSAPLTFASPPIPSPMALPRAPIGFTSQIISHFPALFGEFDAKRFTLLWRGSRDGFGARDFHGHCDGHANTLTLIEDTQKSIFGGFTPVEWESRTKAPFGKADLSLQTFLFTLKNPHDFPERKFPLIAEKKGQAIHCKASDGPHFFGSIAVLDNCNENDQNASEFGHHYVNNSGLEGLTFFTGGQYFTVKEIEVFEITD